MNDFKDFRAWLIPILFGLVVTVGGYMFTAQAEALGEAVRKQSEHGERIAKLEAIVENQQLTNERLEKIVERLSAR
jgi:hypothetical protein